METQTDRLTETKRTKQNTVTGTGPVTLIFMEGTLLPSCGQSSSGFYMIIMVLSSSSQVYSALQCHTKPSPPHYSALVTQYPEHCRLHYTLTAVSLEPENRTHFTDNTQKCFFGTSYHLKYVLHFKIKTYKSYRCHNSCEVLAILFCF